ncbi:hypothetical protein [Eubacterium sp.]
MISCEEEQKRRYKFTNILKKLVQKDITNDKKICRSLYAEIRCVYTGNSKEIDFRHYYSDVFSTLITIKNEGKNLELISSNLKILYEFSMDKKEYGVSECIRKLLDHTNLEVARINYLSLLDDKKINPKEIDESLNTMKERVEKLTKDTDSAYSNFISILGIFSAVVMVFFGGSTVFSKAIGHIYDTPIDRMVLICTLCGVIIFNIIFMFIYFLSKLLDKPISATVDSVYWMNIFTRFRLRYPIVFYVNLFGCVAILISSIFIIEKKILNLKVNGEKIYIILREQLYKFSLEHSQLLVLLIVFAIFNILFFIAYIIAKLLDVNIGCNITIQYKDTYWWDFHDEKYVIYNNGAEVKTYDDENKMLKYLNAKNKRHNLEVNMYNFFKRAFVRYPYFSIGNIILIVSMFRSI